MGGEKERRGLGSQKSLVGAGNRPIRQPARGDQSLNHSPRPQAGKHQTLARQAIEPPSLAAWDGSVCYIGLREKTLTIPVYARPGRGTAKAGTVVAREVPLRRGT